MENFKENYFSNTIIIMDLLNTRRGITDIMVKNVEADSIVLR